MFFKKERPCFIRMIHEKPFNNNKKEEGKITAFTISLVDNDYTVCANTDLDFNGNEVSFKKFLREINEELIIGKTAYLKIEGYEPGTITLEVSKFE